MIRQHSSPVVRNGVRLLLPLAQLYALYVLTHGHYGPGGGFQAGTILAAGFILDFLTCGRESPRRQLIGRKAVILGAVGVGIYLGIGLISMLAGENFLDYGALPFSGLDPATRRSYGILGIETGVCLAVTAVLVAIFTSLGITDE